MSRAAALGGVLRQVNIPALDGIRAIAVFLVILYHFVNPGIPGRLGVVMFFVLSGFLITWLLLCEEDRTGSVSPANFYKRRTLRIFPAFYCYWCIHVGYLLATSQPIPWHSALSAFAYVSNYFLGFAAHPYPRIMVHTWSLSMEEQFYLIWPWIFLWQRRRPRRLVIILSVAIVAVQFWRAFAIYALGIDPRHVDFTFEARCDALLLGCLVAVLLKYYPKSRVWDRLTAHALLPAIPVLGLVGLSWAIYGRPSLETAVGYTIASYLIAAGIVQMIAFHNVAPWSWLNWGVLRYLGRISYPLYLYHILTMEIGERLLPHAAWRYQLATGFVLTILCATASYRLVERPVLSLKNRWIRPARGAARTVGAAQ